MAKKGSYLQDYLLQQNERYTPLLGLALTFPFFPVLINTSEKLHSSDHGCPVCQYPPPIVQYHFCCDTETGDARLFDSEGGESVSHGNGSRQRCVSLLAISCVLVHSDFGSCLLQFLSLGPKEDLTLCLPDTETSRSPGLPLAQKTKKIMICHQRKVRTESLSITQT